jgi:hypothetical protein
MNRSNDVRTNIVVGNYTASDFTGDDNLFLGNYNALGASDRGNNNVVVGNSAAAKLTGSSNIIIGSNAAGNAKYNTINNRLIISNQSTATPLLEGEFDNKKLTINGKLSTDGIAINGDPKPSAVVDLSNSKKGFLPPRLLASERDAIVSPEQGLMIYCSDCSQKGQAQLFDGTSWVDFLGNPTSQALQAGTNYQGGKIAYVYKQGDNGYDPKVVHGIIVSTVDQTANATSGYYPGDTGCMWQVGTYISAQKTTIFDVTNATGTELGSGKTNTEKIKQTQTNTGRPFAAGNFAFTYNGGGYTDWVLPSREELKKYT